MYMMQAPTVGQHIPPQMTLLTPKTPLHYLWTRHWEMV